MGAPSRAVVQAPGSASEARPVMFSIAAGSSGAPAAEGDFAAMYQEELRKAAKELGVRQKGLTVAELKAACECAVREQQQQKTLTVWMAGNARVAESAAAPLDSNLEHSGAGAVLDAAPGARLCPQSAAAGSWGGGLRQQTETSTL